MAHASGADTFIWAIIKIIFVCDIQKKICKERMRERERE